MLARGQAVQATAEPLAAQGQQLASLDKSQQTLQADVRMLDTKAEQSGPGPAGLGGGPADPMEQTAFEKGVAGSLALESGDAPGPYIKDCLAVWHDRMDRRTAWPQA